MSFRDGNDDWRSSSLTARLQSLQAPQASAPAASASPQTLGAWSATGATDSAARFLGTDRKTLLLVGVLGLLGGYLLHDTIRSLKRRPRRRPSKSGSVGEFVRMNKPAVLGVAILGGAAYWYYRNRQAYAAPRQPAPPAMPAPKAGPR